VAAAVALGLDADGVANAMALAVPAAGGVQRAFGTIGKSLQVGFAADAGVRAARLAAAGAPADSRTLADWMRLVGGEPNAVVLDGPAVPDGLAVKLYPCCYALQRPISAVAQLGTVEAEAVEAVEVRTPASSLQPLAHHAPVTGLEGKFSLEYGIATAVLDRHPGVESFSDEAVARPEARRLMERVSVRSDSDGEGLLSGEVEIEVRLAGGERLRTSLDLPPGAPGRPAGDEELERKLRVCAPNAVHELQALNWHSAADYLRARA
jgi:2-methylcitrate dehydratase PrpD